MFEPVYIEKEEECEECGYRDVLFDAIIDGQARRICNRCVIANCAIVLKKPADVKIEEVPRRSVSEIMASLSGVKPRPLEKPATAVKLEDLRQRYEEAKERKRLLREAQEKERQVTQQSQSIGVKEKILDEKEFVKHLETTAQQEKKLEQPPKAMSEEQIDFSIEATKRTRIRDLLEKMQRIDEQEEKV
ncbi:MAG: coiled-coil domain-containing family 149 protein [Candidatus Pacearchaeota archaeon]|nr:coiled-coil domain-containing family 149 protein [Candidatus Pacearchaeota archaeon]